MPNVEQVRQKRSGTGLRAWDRERAFEGFTIFTPMAGGNEVYLIDMAGEVVHRWQTPYPPGLYGRLTERGTLLYNGKTPEQPGRFIAQAAWKGGAILEMTWDGRVLWEVNHPDHHHDGILLHNGNVLLVCIAPLSSDIATAVQGGTVGSEFEGQMHADYLVEMTRGGEVVWEWRSWEHLDPVEDSISVIQNTRAAWTHCNSVSELPDGNLLLSFRNLSLVAILDRGTGELIWRISSPTVAQQHAPVMLDNGNILLFDNGTHRIDHLLPYSRVIEIDPATKEIVWRYQEEDVSQFFSPLISSAERLPNGNTLICEGTFGRLFEVTSEGDVVWEYINPFFVDDVSTERVKPVNRVFRAYRYSAADIDRARATANLR